MGCAGHDGKRKIQTRKYGIGFTYRWVAGFAWLSVT
jgi:hypothetical protein